jgi:hypothetical protein
MFLGKHPFEHRRLASHLVALHRIAASHCMASHRRLALHLVVSRRIALRSIALRSIASSHRIALDRLASHHIASRRIAASHRIAALFHCIASRPLASSTFAIQLLELVGQCSVKIGIRHFPALSRSRNSLYFTTPVPSTSCGADDDGGGVDDKEESEPAFLES